MTEVLASIKETVDLTAREVLDDALRLLAGQGYRTTLRTSTSLTVTRLDRTSANDAGQLDLTILALPQPQGGVQVTVKGSDRDGVHERQSEWTEWANSLPKRPNGPQVEQPQNDAQLPAPIGRSKPAVAPQKTVAVPENKAASADVIFDRPDQLEKIRAGLLSGEIIEAVFDLKGSGTGFMGITSKRVIFQDNAWVTGVKAVVSIPYSRIHTVAAEDAVGVLTGRGFFSSSKIVLTTSAGARTFQFRGADKAHIAHDLILKHIL